MTGIIQYRSCVVSGEKARFHVWEQYSEVIAPGMAIGSHQGGQISQVFGIVEFEDGTVKRVDPYKIEFTDRQVKSYEQTVKKETL